MRAADVNGDGKDDVVGAYDYGGGLMKMWGFISDGSRFRTVSRFYASCAGCWQLASSQMTTTDVNGDGKDDIVVAYDYGGGTMSLWNFVSNGAAFDPVKRAYSGCAGCWDLSHSQMVGADLNADGKGDIVGIYDYGAGVMGMWSFIGNGSGYAPGRSYSGCGGCWTLSQAQMVVGDVNADGKSDVVGAYDYGANEMGMWHFINDGGFRPHRSY